jgi:hypothetical protein
MYLALPLDPPQFCNREEWYPDISKKNDIAYVIISSKFMPRISPKKILVKCMYIERQQTHEP